MVVVRNSHGDEAIGSAFHVGDGVFLTARHVTENNELIKIEIQTGGYLFADELQVKVDTKAILPGDIPIWRLTHDELQLSEGPFYHEDDSIDVSAFKLDGLDINTPSVVLGGHYDDWINDLDWLLTKSTLYGFPPIPTSKFPVFVAVTGEINAVVDTYRDRYVRFAVSAAPRGGFSGGLAYHEWGFALGMITESLEFHSSKNEMGFLTVLGVEALRECLEQHHLLPTCQKLD